MRLRRTPNAAVEAALRDVPLSLTSPLVLHPGGLVLLVAMGTVAFHLALQCRAEAPELGDATIVGVTALRAGRDLDAWRALLQPSSTIITLEDDTGALHAEVCEIVAHSVC